MDGLRTQEELNLIPLCSYDVLLEMDWLDAHKVRLNVMRKSWNMNMRRVMQGFFKAFRS
jgi:hypothetical protein